MNPPPPPPSEEGISSTASLLFTVGTTVTVEARTWPGINKPGGVGKVTKVHENNAAVDVKYVIEGRERRIPIQYVRLLVEKDQLRDRKMLLGRCRNCGSLKRDCGSCESSWQQLLPMMRSGTTTTTKQRRRKVSQLQEVVEDNTNDEDDDDSSSSSDDSLLLPVNKEWRRNDSSRLKKLMKYMNDDSSATSKEEEASCSSSSSSSDDDQVLMALQTTSRRVRSLATLKRLERETKPKRRMKKRSASSSSTGQQRSITTARQRVEAAGDDGSAPAVPNQDHPRKSRGHATRISQQSHEKDVHEVDDDAMSFAQDDDSIVGDADMSQEDESPLSPPRRSLTHRVSESPDGDETRSPVMLVDNDLGGFIQPEGTATTLPNDTHDKSADVDYADLPSLFEELMDAVHRKFPRARAAFEDLQQRFEMRKAANGSSNFADLEEEGWSLYDDTKDTLLLDGLDQCRNILPRLANRNPFKAIKGKLTLQQRKPFSRTAQATRDLLFDQVDHDVEALMREMRVFLADKLPSARDGDDYLYRDDDEEYLDDEVVQEENAAAASPLVRNQEEETDSLLPDFDPHMHARRVRSAKRKPFDPHIMHARRASKPKKHARRRRRTGGGSSSKREQRKEAGSRNHGQRHSDDDSQDSGSDEQIHSRRKRRRENAAGDGRSTYSRNRSKKTSSKSRAQRSNSSRSASSIIDENNMTMGDFFNSEPTGAQQTAPSLDRLLASNSASRSVPKGLPGKQQRTSNQAAAVDRMQAFLEANSGNIGETLGNTVSRNASSDHRRRRRGERTDNATRTTSAKPASVSTVQDWDKRVFEALERSEAIVEDPPEYHSRDTIKSLRTLRSHCQLSPRENEVTTGLIEKLSGGGSLSRNDIVSVFAMVHRTLKNDPVILQELVLTDASRLSRRLELIGAIVMLLNQNLNSQLEECDGVLFKLFSTVRPCPFVQAVVLQFLDVLFAFFNPGPWGLAGRGHKLDVLETFSRLRDDLACHIPLLETTCEFVSRRVEPQEYRKSMDGLKVFVSSVHPPAYISCLESGEQPKPQKVRMNELKPIPRAELGAMWSIMGYVAGAKYQCMAPVSKFRWRLLYGIMCGDAGVLPKQLETFGKSAASAAQLLRCEEELGYVALLLSRGSLSPLDDTVKLVELIMRRSLLLQARGSDSASLPHLFGLDQGKNAIDKDSALFLWERSRLLSEPEPLESCTLLKQPLLTGVVQKATDLLGHWIHETKEKPVLWNQLSASISKLQKLEEECSPKSSTPKADDNSFQRSFSLPEASSGDFVREAALHMTVALDVLRTECSHKTKKPFISKASLTKFWSATSTSEMKRQREALAGDSQELEGQVAGPFIRYFTTARAFCLYLSSYLGISVSIIGHNCAPGLNRQFVSDDKGPLLHFTFSCIFTSVQTLCTSIVLSTRRQSSATSNVEVAALTSALTWLNQIVGECRQLQKHDAANNPLASELRTLGSSILELGAKSLRQCLLTALITSECEGSHVCFRICLAMIRCVAAWNAEAVQLVKRSNKDDEFGDLDDDLLLGIEIPNQKRETEAERLFSTLRKILDLGDSSDTYRVQRNMNFGENVVTVGSRERRMVFRFAGGLCSCLSTLRATLSGPQEPPRLLGGSVPNGTYHQDWNRTFLAETSKLASGYPLCKNFIQERHSSCTLALLEMALDAGAIERFPCCDQGAMMKLAGEQAVQKEHRKMSVLKGRQLSMLTPRHGCVGAKKSEEIDEAGLVYASNNLWFYYQDLRNQARSSSTIPAFALLASTASVAVMEGNAPPSMELECIRRLKLFVTFFSHRELTSPAPIYEELLMGLIRKAASNILQISGALQYRFVSQKQSSSQLLTHKQGKLKLLQSYYVEMFVTFLSVSVLVNWELFSDGLRGALTNLREVFFFRILRWEDNDVEGCLRGIAGNAHPSQNSKNAKTSPMLDLRRCVGRSSLRRSREIVRYHFCAPARTDADRKRGVIALISKTNSFDKNAVLSTAAGLGMMAQGFQNKIEPSDNSDWKLSVFEELVDEYTDTLQPASEARLANTTGRTGTDHSNHVRALRRFALTTAIPPRLRSAQTNEDTEAKLVALTNRLLYIELQDLKGSSAMDVQNLVDFDPLVRSCWTATQDVISKGNFASPLSSLMFRCLSTFMVLPCVGSDDKASQPLLAFCESFKNQINPNMIPRGKLALFAAYISTFALVAEDLAKSVGLEDPDARKTEIEKLRDAIRKPNEVSSSLAASTGVQSGVRKLRALDAALLADDKENASRPKNVYTQKKTSNMGPCDSTAATAVSTAPSRETKSEAANFTAVIHEMRQC